MGFTKQGKEPTGKVIQSSKICKKCNKVIMVNQVDPSTKIAAIIKCPDCGSEVKNGSTG